MGFGFNLGIFFVVIPVTILLIIFWLTTQKSKFLLPLLFLWGSILLLAIISYASKGLHSKIVLEKSDYYGEYIIDRNYFSGKQADWQYNHYRFEIKENDSIYFYVTNGLAIKHVFKGSISTEAPYKSARLLIEMENPTHHIISSNPTIYRDVWDFYMVLNSPKYYNMFFRKGKWKPIE